MFSCIGLRELGPCAKFAGSRHIAGFGKHVERERWTDYNARVAGNAAIEYSNATGGNGNSAEHFSDPGLDDDAQHNHPQHHNTKHNNADYDDAQHYAGKHDSERQHAIDHKS